MQFVNATVIMNSRSGRLLRIEVLQKHKYFHIFFMISFELRSICNEISFQLHHVHVAHSLMKPHDNSWKSFSLNSTEIFTHWNSWIELFLALSWIAVGVTNEVNIRRENCASSSILIVSVRSVELGLHHNSGFGLKYKAKMVQGPRGVGRAPRQNLNSFELNVGNTGITFQILVA